MEQARIEHAPNGSLLTYITSADALVSKGRKYFFFISKFSGDIIISYMEVDAIFCTRMAFNFFCFVMSLDVAEIKKYRKHVHGDDIQDV